LACSDLVLRLTDQTIRKNYQEYGHPDGRQEITMGIALPRWIVEAHNNAWVLAFYGSLFGVGLPIVVVCIFFFELRI
jgi:translocation protein SEC63